MQDVWDLFKKNISMLSTMQQMDVNVLEKGNRPPFWIWGPFLNIKNYILLLYSIGYVSELIYDETWK